MQNQDLRIRKTYAALTQAFQTLLVQKEFKKISVNELCELAMIRRPTFYKHFLDKYDFLNFFIKHKIEEIFSKALINGDGTPLNFYTIAFESILDMQAVSEHFLQNIQINYNLFRELKPVRQFWEIFFTNQVYSPKSSENVLDFSYKSQIILTLTLNSAIWYIENNNDITREDMVIKYQNIIRKIL